MPRRAEMPRVLKALQRLPLWATAAANLFFVVLGAYDARRGDRFGTALCALLVLVGIPGLILKWSSERD